jgi:hypothetical protein
VLRVPGVVVNDDVIELFFTSQYRRKHDSVVIDARLCSKLRHLLPSGRAR